LLLSDAVCSSVEGCFSLCALLWGFCCSLLSIWSQLCSLGCPGAVFAVWLFMPILFGLVGDCSPRPFDFFIVVQFPAWGLFMLFLLAEQALLLCCCMLVQGRLFLCACVSCYRLLVVYMGVFPLYVFGSLYPFFGFL
jgi:hypothetical protein